MNNPSFEPREGLAICRAKAVPSFFSYFKTSSIGPAPGIELATSHSTVKRSTDSTNPAAVDQKLFSFSSIVFFRLLSLSRLALRYLQAS